MAIITQDMYQGFAVSVNGKTGVVVLVPEDIGAYSPSTINEAVVPVILDGTQSRTLILNDRGGFIRFTSGIAVACTIPSNANVAFPVGTVVSFMQQGTGQVTFIPDGGVTLLAEVGLKTNAQNALVTAIKIDVDTWSLSGSMVA